MNLTRPCLIGVVHLPPLPGAPGWKGDIDAVVARALSDAQTYAAGGMSAVIIENFGDTPFFKDAVPPETVAAMARAGAEIRNALDRDFPIGFNVLRNDADAALGLCAACGGEFIRVNVHTGAMLTDQGIIEGRAAETVRRRERICRNVKIFADVLVKHATPLGANPDLARIARDTWQRGRADALIVTGSGTGRETPAADLRIVRDAVPEAPLFAGSGANAENVKSLLEIADGVIVGSSLKAGGDPKAVIDPDRVARFVEAAG